MSSISWPIILSGDYSDGSVCNAADYKNDFYMLRDAVNQLYERFSSYRVNARAKTYFGKTVASSVAKEYMDLASAAAADASFCLDGNAVDSDNERSRRLVRQIIQIPTWMQGVRIRGLNALNLSQIPYHADMEFQYEKMPPTVGVSVGASLASFDWRDGFTAFDDGSGAVDVVKISFGDRDGTGTAQNTNLNKAETYAGGAGESYTEVNAIGGPNYSLTSTTQEFRPVMQAKTADYVVEPGQFIALWIAGSVEVTNGHGSDTVTGPYFLEYSWDVLLDAMIPIP
tara:strand:- start:1083 stop:1934 length:852 start_codon:yes stop_codon:yes gene_type:complete